MKTFHRHKKYDMLKTFIDFVGALTLLVCLSPLLIIVYFLCLVIHGTPVIFAQERLTINGNKFLIYKFRSMTKNAELQSGAVWAGKSDSRITPFGKVLRSTRLDELPQLINVLRGEMSLIGPRPERPEISEEITRMIPSFKKRLAVKAGITGLAQTEGGYASSIEGSRKKAALDILYVQHRSLWLDILIAIKTLGVIITGTGSR